MKLNIGSGHSRLDGFTSFATAEQIYGVQPK